MHEPPLDIQRTLLCRYDNICFLNGNVRNVRQFSKTLFWDNLDNCC